MSLKKIFLIIFIFGSYTASASDKLNFNLNDDEVILFVASTQDEAVGHQAIRNAVESFVMGKLEYNNNSYHQIYSQLSVNDSEDESYRPIGGLSVGSFVPFGVGHAIQGRWSESNGAIFTFGQLGTAVGTFAFAAKGYDTAALVSLLGFGGLRVWEVIDLASGVDWGNSTVRNISVATLSGLAAWKTFDLVKGLLTRDNRVAFNSDGNDSSFIDDMDFTLSALQQEENKSLAIGVVFPTR